MQCSACATSTIRLVLRTSYGIDYSATRLFEKRSASAIEYSFRGRPNVCNKRLCADYHTLPALPSTERDESYIPFDGCNISSPTNINAEDDRATDTALVTEVRLSHHPSLLFAPSPKHTFRGRSEPRVLQVSKPPWPSNNWSRRTEKEARSSLGAIRSQSAGNDTHDKGTGPSVGRTEVSNTEREPWQVQKQALSQKFGSTGWAPRKRLSPDTLEGIRALHTQHPETYTTPLLAQKFQVSPEAIRRILKSKWRPTEEEEGDRLRRWDKRGEEIWSQLVEIGIKPPKKWRDMGVGRDEENRTAPRSKTVARMLENRDVELRQESQVPKYAAASTSASKSLLAERIL